jgi:hypothetical protein
MDYKVITSLVSFIPSLHFILLTNEALMVKIELYVIYEFDFSKDSLFIFFPDCVLILDADEKFSVLIIWKLIDPKVPFVITKTGEKWVQKNKIRLYS